MTYSFNSSLRHGKIGEKLFEEAHKGVLKRTDGLTCDFYMCSNGEGVELKSDSYELEATPNFFFERFSNVEKQSPGGPWQAKAHGAKHFAYFYVPSLTYYWFDTDKLLARLDEITPALKPMEIRNTTYFTMGYKVAREAVVDLATKHTLSVSIG